MPSGPEQEKEKTVGSCTRGSQEAPARRHDECRVLMGGVLNFAVLHGELQGEDLEELLRPKQSEHEEMVQSAEISDANLELLLDRSDMLPSNQSTDTKHSSKSTSGKSGPKKGAKSLPLAGPGWEVVTSGAAQGSLLSSIS